MKRRLYIKERRQVRNQRRWPQRRLELLQSFYTLIVIPLGLILALWVIFEKKETTMIPKGEIRVQSWR